jgi:hypothetical protein
MANHSGAQAISYLPYAIRQLGSFGDKSDGGTPGPFPNPVVKPISADDTAPAAVWERRPSPEDPFCFSLSPRASKLYSQHPLLVLPQMHLPP